MIVVGQCRPLSALVARLLALSPSTNALVATTAAVTTVQATGTQNVLPQHGKAVLNFRHLPGDALQLDSVPVCSVNTMYTKHLRLINACPWMGQLQTGLSLTRRVPHNFLGRCLQGTQQSR